MSELGNLFGVAFCLAFEGYIQISKLVGVVLSLETGTIKWQRAGKRGVFCFDHCTGFVAAVLELILSRLKLWVTIHSLLVP